MRTIQPLTMLSGLIIFCVSTESQSSGAFDANKTYPQLAAAEARSATWVAIASPLAGDLNANGYANYEIGLTPGGPFIDAFGGQSIPTNIGGPSGWRSGVVTGLTPGTDYYFRVSFFDPDGVASLSSAESAVQILHVKTPPATDATATDNRVEIGTVTAEVRDTEILVSAPIRRDANANSTGYVEVAEYTGQDDSMLTWVARCRSTAKLHPKTCRVRSLVNGKSYKLRFTITDPDGIASGAAVQIIGPLSYWGATNIAYQQHVIADPGWGCCPNPQEAVDGIIQAEQWTYGYAWTGGTSCWAGGCPAGYNKSITIDFGVVRNINRFIIWFHDANSVPARWKIEVPSDPKNPSGPYTKIYPPGPEDAISYRCRADTVEFTLDWGLPACSHDATFPVASARYVRYTFDDTTLFGGFHGWIVELEAFEVPQIQFSTASLIFGPTPVFGSALAQTISVTNVGTVPLQIASVNVIGQNAPDFEVTSACPNQIPAGAPSCGIQVVFAPQVFTLAAPAHNALVEIQHNGPVGVTDISLTGTVLPPTGPSYSVSTSALEFGQAQGFPSPPSQNVTIVFQNKPANSPISASVSVSNSNAFNLANNCALVGTIATGSCSVVVTFFATALGEYLASLNVTLPGSTAVTVSLKGRVYRDDDQDGIPDDWEQPTSPPLFGESVNLYQLGARVGQKDIFVEIDYMEGNGHSHQPKVDAIQEVVDAFNNNGYALHVDCGPNCPLTAQQTWGAYSKSNSIQHEDPITHSINELGETVSAASGDILYNWASFDLLKSFNFGHDSGQFAPSRPRVFHYAIFAHNLYGSAATGIARVGGSDLIVSLGSTSGAIGDVTEQAGTFMHELGHNLGLDHGGADSINHKPNYPSVMNYFFQTRGVIVNGNEGVIDFLSPQHAMQLITLNETKLDESVGIGTNAFGTRYYCRVGSSIEQQITLFAGSVDWDCQNGAHGIVVSDTNGDGVLTGLTIRSDWDHLVLNGGGIGGFGNPPMQTPLRELTVNDDGSIKQIQKVRVIAPPDLAILPGQTQALQFQVVNEGSMDTNYAISVTGASQGAPSVTSSSSSQFQPLGARVPLSAGTVAIIKVPISSPFAASVASSSVKIQVVAKHMTNSNITDSGVTVVTSGLSNLSVVTNPPVSAVVGKPTAVGVIVSNHGHDTAVDTVLKIVLPGTARFGSSVGGNCQGLSTIYCQIGDLVPGGSVSLPISVIADSPGSVLGTVSVSSRTLEADPIDNSAPINFGVVGVPRLSATILNSRITGSVVNAILQLSNDSQGPVASGIVQTIVPRILSGSGSLSMQTPATPMEIGPLPVGGTKNVPIAIVVNGSVTRIGLTETGSMRDSAGNSYSFSTGQAFIPVP